MKAIYSALRASKCGTAKPFLPYQREALSPFTFDLGPWTIKQLVRGR